MSERPIRVLAVNSAVVGGGAEVMALGLHQQLRQRGHSSWLATGHLNQRVDGVYELENGRGVSPKAMKKASSILSGHAESPSAIGRIQRRLATTNSIFGLAAYLRGREQMDYPSTRRMLDEAPGPPDIVHLHNLHGGYFDLRALSAISQRVPVVLTLHDEWLFTGHCAATLGCERWRIGCGNCPDLATYPAIRRDATAENLVLKRKCYARSRYFVTAPSTWVLTRARASIMAEGATGWRRIPNAIDPATFHARDRWGARARIGLADDTDIMVFVAHRARSNPFKSLEDVVSCAKRISVARSSRRHVLHVVGDTGTTQEIGNLQVRFSAPGVDRERMAEYLRAADLMLHSARAEVAGLTVIEALACGTPVVATGIGGIPESIRSLDGSPGSWNGRTYLVGDANGVLVPPDEPWSLAEAATFLLSKRETLHRLSANASRSPFTLSCQADLYVALYRELLERPPNCVGDSHAFRTTSPPRHTNRQHD